MKRLSVALLSFVLACGGKDSPTTPQTPQAKVPEIIMVSVPSGTFQMGSDDGSDDEKPVHTVNIEAFKISKYEITQAQYQDVMGSNPSVYTGYEDRPVESVSWFDAVNFCNNLSEAIGTEPCYNLSTMSCDFSKSGFRLPTEAEWEYACRAGTTTKYCTGDSENDLGRAGWYNNSEGGSHVVGQKEMNAFGLYDMHGNVWEICNDLYDENYYGSSPNNNPKGSSIGERYVIRGGYFGDPAFQCRSANRAYFDNLNHRNSITGFRVVRRVD